MLCSFSSIEKNYGSTTENCRKNSLCYLCATQNYYVETRIRFFLCAPPGTFDLENEDGTIILGSYWRQTQCCNNLERNSQRNISTEAKNIREEFIEYFCREGEVSWQRNYI